VLVAVGVQVAGGERGVRLDVVGELDDLDLQAVAFATSSERVLAWADLAANIRA